MDKLKAWAQRLKQISGIFGWIVGVPLAFFLLGIAFVIEFLSQPFWLPLIAWCLLFQSCEMRNILEKMRWVQDFESNTASDNYRTLKSIESTLEDIERNTDR